MTEQTEATQEKKTAGTPQAVIKGRMPAALVYAVRFGNLADGSKETATLFGTTVGKVYDIQKNRNFTYIEEGDKFNQEAIDEAIDFIKQHPGYDDVDADKVVNYLSDLPIASDEEWTAFQEKKTASRGQNTKTKDGETADAGGGNRRGKGKTEAEPEATEETGDSDNDDLM